MILYKSIYDSVEQIVEMKRIQYFSHKISESKFLRFYVSETLSLYLSNGCWRSIIWLSLSMTTL